MSRSDSRRSGRRDNARAPPAAAPPAPSPDRRRRRRSSAEIMKTSSKMPDIEEPLGQAQQLVALDRVDLVEGEDGAPAAALQPVDDDARLLLQPRARGIDDAAARDRRPPPPARPRGPWRAPAACRGEKMPGVSTKMIWAGPSTRMPSTRRRVVCTLGETMETLAPTRRLSRVDLPALGAPMIATKPQRVGCGPGESATGVGNQSTASLLRWASSSSAAAASAARRERPRPTAGGRPGRLTSISNSGSCAGPSRPTRR